MRIRDALFVLRNLGIRWIIYRIWKISSEKLGYWERRIPSSSWKQIGAQFGDSTDWEQGSQLNDALSLRGVGFLFDGQLLPDAAQYLAKFDPAVDAGEKLLERNLSGKFPFFSGPYQELGDMPDWFVNPVTGETAPSDIHFSRINEFGYGDVKAIWEISRFGFVFDLARAYARTGDERCAQRFWDLFSDWVDKNPPYQGVNWKCGQESGLRMIAVVFGYFTFRHLSSFSGKQANMLMHFLAATGFRIERQIQYAISQKNNHGVSEAVALWTLGVLFPNLKRAEAWKKKGTEVLADLCDELIYDDGGFSQHSANYHRLLLHLIAWTIMLARVNQIELPKSIHTRFEVATQFIYQLLDQKTGRVPRYGNDDGSLLFPLSCCEYQDYRPVVNLCLAIISQKTHFGRGPWDEDLLWFGLDQLPEATTAEKEQKAAVVSMASAGCHIIRGTGSFVFIRAGSFVHRPTQLDMMHVDVWAGGNNIALDPGTYSYNAPGIWQDIPFARSGFHNSITVDGKEFAKKLSKFLFAPWPECKIVCHEEASEFSYFLFRREISFELKEPVTHWRLICRLPHEIYMVLDRLNAGKKHDYRLHWLLGGEILKDSQSNQVSMQFENGQKYHIVLSCLDPTHTTHVVSDFSSGRGLFAPRYFELAPALSLATYTSAKETQFVSFFGPDRRSLEKLSEKAAEKLTLNPSINNNDARSLVNKFIGQRVLAQ